MNKNIFDDSISKQEKYLDIMIQTPVDCIPINIHHQIVLVLKKNNKINEWYKYKILF